MRRAIILLIVIFLVGCTEESFDLNEDESDSDVTGNISERISDENEMSDVEKSDWIKIVGNHTDIHRGLYVHFNGVFSDPSSRKLYFSFDAEDRFENEVARDALQWNAFIYFAKKNTFRLFLCNFENNGLQWRNEYCEPEDEIPEKWFDQNVWIVYTLQTPEIINDNSILDIRGREYTYIFKVNIPKQ